MPIAAAVPAIIGAGASLGSAALGKRMSGAGSSKYLQEQGQYLTGQGIKQQIQAGNDLGEFESPTGLATDTPLYKRMLTLSTDSTTNAYNNVRSKQAAAARAAGFGYAQPIAQGGQSAVDVAEAGDIGRLPNEVANSIAPMMLSAANVRAGMGSGNINAATSDNAAYSRAYEAEQDRTSSMWSNIANVAGGLAKNLTEKFSKAKKDD